MNKVSFSNLPIGQLLILEKQYERVQEQFFELNALFEIAVEKIDFDFYGEEKELLESYLVKLNKLKDDLKMTSDRLQNLKQELTN
ncbi:MAG: hypothetical protein WC554_05980 [Clostridia bacterium]|jgi:hypothetical protein